jgi:hypothetical protein
MSRRNTLHRIAVALAARCLIAGSGFAALIDNFDPPNPNVTSTQAGSAPGPTVTAGGPTGQFLRLMQDGTGGQDNRYSYDRTDVGAFSTITADFDFRGFSANQPADGFSIALLPTSAYGTSGGGPGYTAEEPNAGGTFGVGFDNHPGGQNNVSTHFDGSQRNEKRVALSDVSFRNGVMHHAQVSLQQIGQGSNVRIDLTNDINGAASPTVTPLHHYIAGLVPYENRVHFAARSGGADMDVDLDNINVQYNSPYAAPPTISPATLSQDFDSLGTTLFRSTQGVTTPGPLVQAGGPTGNYIRLTHDNVRDNRNAIAFDRAFDGGVSNSLKSDFDFRMASAGFAADGMSILFLPTNAHGDSGPGLSPTSFDGENPNVAGALGIGFRLHPEDGGVNDISLHWNGSQIQRVTLNPGTQIDLNAGLFHHAEVISRHVAGGSRVSVTLTPDVHGTPGTPVDVFGGPVFVPGMVPYDYRVQFTGRTGGRFHDADLDNILSGTAPGAQGPDPIQDFDGGGSQYKAFSQGTTPHPVIQTGGPTGNYLRLMHAVNGQNPTLDFDQTADGTAGPKLGVRAWFDYRMSADTASPENRADGFGFALLDVGTYGTSGAGPTNGFTGKNWERPSFPDLFGVGFDIYNGSNENTVSLNWAGSQVAAQFIDPTTNFALNNDLWNRVYVELVDAGPDALATVSIAPDIFGTPGAPFTVFSNQLISGFDLDAFDFRVGFGGRTAGLNTALDLDNIRVLIDVPEPTTLSLLALGGLALARRRRRRT